MDETDVAITKHKKKLDAIREKDTHGKIDRGHAEIAERGIQTTQGTDQGDAGSVQGVGGNFRPGEEGMESREGIARGNGEGIRSIDSEDEPATQGAYPSDREVRERKLTTDLTPEQKADRDKELHRQRQARYRERQQEANSSSETVTSRHFLGDATGATATATSDGYVTQSDAKFQFKSPFKLSGKEPEKVKLFTKTEAEESEDAIIKVLMAGTSILDDLLEIVVKDHEPVRIWEMDEDEATLFAQAHLKRAQKDQDAARVARKLIQIHDKLLTFQYLFSRSKATVTHVKEHGGFGFR